MATLSIHGDELVLLPEKAAYWPAGAALLVADVHLGKSETFQRWGIPIPSQVNTATLDRLQRVCDRTQARQLFILGDLFHAQAGCVDAVIDGWQTFLATTQVAAHLIVGNHDRALANTLAALSLTCHTHPIAAPPWLFSHEPVPAAAGVNVCGHVHPCVRLGGKGDRLRLPCFYWEANDQRLTLPAFGEFTGGYDVAIAPGTTAYVIAEDAVIPFDGARSRSSLP